ncbi:MAG: hypothetical protein J0L75_17285 [Spirochaetes bacterium]|nr:hypothetical protein [Spirochaetota bacterium]
MRKQGWKLFLALGLVLSAISCTDGRKVWSSGEKLDSLRQARSLYRAKDYSNAAIALRELLQGGLATGDVLFYYAKSLDVLEGGAAASAELIGYYEQATNWFGTYKSEFAEDENREKAYYNLGVMYYRRTPAQDLHRTKAIWDAARKAGADSVLVKQKQYDLLVFQLPLFDAEMAARSLRDRLTAARTAEELAEADREYQKALKAFDVKPFLGREDNQIQPSDLLLHLLRRWDTVLAERRQELGLR